MHNSNSMSSGHYYCDILYFNTRIWWRCDGETVTELKVLPYNVHCVFTISNLNKRGKKVVMTGLEIIFSMIYTIKNVLKPKMFEFLLDGLMKTKKKI